MSKTSTDAVRHALNGPTMGTRWSALFFRADEFGPEPVGEALQDAVDAVDAQMSTWRPDSALMRLNAAPVGEWLRVPAPLAEVLRLGLAVGRASGGAFDIAVGDAVAAWGFGPAGADPVRIRAALAAGRPPAHELLEVEGDEVRKRADVTLDLNGIAKGYGVDRMAQTLRAYGIRNGLVGIDGEMRALGVRPDGAPWSIAVEMPDHERRTPHSVLTLADGAVATSGDYRHWVTVRGRRLSHTVDPRRGAPLAHSPASVTVIAPSCAEADAWATALMVLGETKGSALARALELDVLFLLRDGIADVRAAGTGRIFSDVSASGEAGAEPTAA